MYMWQGKLVFLFLLPPFQRSLSSSLTANLRSKASSHRQAIRARGLNSDCPGAGGREWWPWAEIFLAASLVGERPLPHAYLAPLDSLGIDGHHPDLTVVDDSPKVARARDAVKPWL